MRLIALGDADVLRVLAVVMGETLDIGTSLVELLGQQLAVDMADVWQADDVLLGAVRDREVMGLLLTEVAGDVVAEQNAKATTNVQRGIIRDCLTGANGRAQVEGWVPRWMTFAPAAYTARGGVGSAERAASLAKTGTVQTEPVEPGTAEEPADNCAQSCASLVAELPEAA